MKRVVIESPFAGDIEANKDYLRLCLRDSVQRGEAPFASHGFYPDFMSEETERERGILLGYEWGTQAELVAVYIDRGVSKGMSEAMKFYADNGLKIDVRLLPAGCYPAFQISRVLAAAEKILKDTPSETAIELAEKMELDINKNTLFIQKKFTEVK